MCKKQHTNDDHDDDNIGDDKIKTGKSSKSKPNKNDDNPPLKVNETNEWIIGNVSDVKICSASTRFISTGDESNVMINNRKWYHIIGYHKRK